ncbi:MAG: alpha-galactosidase [Terracidiphilus sp.]
MRRLVGVRCVQWCIVFFTSMFSVRVWGQAAAPVSLQENGWTIECSLESSSLTISAKDLGSVAQHIQLNEETPSGLHRLTHFSASINAKQQLIIETIAPKTAWVFAALPGKVAVSTTGFHGVLTGWAASSTDRTIAILLDRQGEPVQWQGTKEIVGAYGGTQTSNQSYLPRRHPEVMHMGLGHVSGAGMHSLFDRKTDIAIDFGEDAALQADEGSKDAYALTIPVRDSATIQLTPNYYTQVLGVPFYTRYDDTNFPSAPIVWASWLNYYATVTEQDIIRNADWLSKNLKQYGLEYVRLDDGYDRDADFNYSADTHSQDHSAPHPEEVGHTWLHWNSDRFPHDPEWLTNHIHADGLKAGIWLVPNSYGSALKEHPDWYLYDKQDKVLQDYSTPALDSTNPHVFEHLKSLFTKLDTMGFDYYMFDGEHALPAYAPTVDKSRLHSPSIDFVENYRERLALIRQTIGRERFIEVCPAGTPLNGMGFFDAYFNGMDLYGNWQGMHSLFSSIGSNLFLNHMVSYVMPGEGLELSEPMTMTQAAAKRAAVVVDVVRSREDPPTGLGVTLAEARTLVTYDALTGVVYSVGSVMPELPRERVKLLQATMPTLPILPIDLFSRGSNSDWDTFKHFQSDYYINHYPELMDLKVNSSAGVYDVVAETNWMSDTTERRLDFGQLGVAPGRRYVIFDFWKQQPLGIFEDKIDLSIASHDTRVLLIHPLADRPQLIGNSRHISGTYSILSQGWNGTEKELHGESATIPGEPYTLWFSIPDGYKKSLVQVSLKIGKAIDAEWHQEGGFGRLSFTGADGPVEWRIRF